MNVSPPDTRQADMKTLLEHLDALLLESPESLGVPKRVAEVFEDVIPYRKNAHYAAEFWLNGKDSVSPLYADNIQTLISIQDQKTFLKKMGVRRAAKDPDMPERDIEVEFNRILLAPRSRRELLTLRKKLLKAISSRSDVRETKSMFDIDLEMKAKGWLQSRRNKALVKMLRNNRDAYKHFKGDDFKQAKKRAAEIVSKQSIDKSKIDIRFPDGYYWYQLSKEECSLEGELMQHCGAASFSENTVYSLRDDNGDPHVTLEYSPRKNEIVQIRGKQNKLPKKKYWKYVKGFVDKHDPYIDTDWSEGAIIEFMDYITQDSGRSPSLTRAQIKELKDKVIPPKMRDIRDSVDQAFERTTLDGFVSLSEGPRLDTSLTLSISYKDLPVLKNLTQYDDAFVDEVLEVVEEYLKDKIIDDAIMMDRLEMLGVTIRGSNIPVMNISNMQFEHGYDELNYHNVIDYLDTLEGIFSPYNLEDIISDLQGMIAEIIEEENETNI